MSDKIILQDVANDAGVSLRTASRVLNDDPKVSEATREKVRSVIRALNYAPDVMARSLRAGRDDAVGLVVESVADPFFSELVGAVELASSGTSTSVLIASTHGDPARERDLVEQMVRRRVSGLIIAPTDADHSWLRPIATGTPVVLVDRDAPEVSADVVAIDDHAATVAAVEHLAAHGHRRIAYVGDRPAVATSRARLAGFTDAMAARGLPVPAAHLRADCPDPRSAAAATHALLAGDSGPSGGSAGSAGSAPTAIISAATRCSLGVVPALHAAGRTDVALVALGDFAMADALTPGVTVLDHPAAEIGRAAAARVAARLAAPELPVVTELVPVTLVPRGSGEQRP
jgi:LacI family transcriptional regulator